jgi:hypothetical protein
MGTNCVLDLPNFHLFSYEFEFSWRIRHVLLCFIDCPLFVGLWMIFLFSIFRLQEFYVPRSRLFWQS